MSAATYEQIVAALGDVDDLTVRRILETGASLDEVGQALDLLEAERDDTSRIADASPLAVSPRVATVRAILDELLDEGDEQAEAYPLA